MTDATIELQSTTKKLFGKSAGTSLFAITILLGAFLLFSVQLVLAKYFLPWFGGTPAVWTTCMFFFQTLLLGGYWYADMISQRLSQRAQGLVHSAILLSSLMVLLWSAVLWRSPLTPAISWRPIGSDHPVLHLIVLLSLAAGLPYFALSSTGPLLQSWFTAVYPTRPPYRLYAVSNFGSLLALSSYPIITEPLFSLRVQSRIWTCGFIIYAVLCGYLALSLAYRKEKIEAPKQGHNLNQSLLRPHFRKRLLWLALAMCACVLFLATTNRICQDIATVPFLWVIPLGLYLLSLIICFDKPTLYSRKVFHPAFAASIGVSCLVLSGWGLSDIKLQIGIYSITLFVSCMVCHGELARIKPDARHLTSFYLMIALGGALGGIFVAVVAPFAFNGFCEYQLGLWGAALLLLLVLAKDRNSWLHSSPIGLPMLGVATASLPALSTLATEGKKGLLNFIPVLAVLIGAYVITRWGRKGENQERHKAVPMFCATALLVLGVVLLFAGRTLVRGTVVTSSRNFYGVLTVKDLNANYHESEFFALYHGHISHGAQFRAHDKRDIPTTYYGTDSGVGRLFTRLQAQRTNSASRSPLRAGIVGLGIGTLAAYGSTGDYLRFYEIDPAVIDIAKDDRYFTFLKDCAAQFDIVPGDARISMERELQQQEPQHFDILVLDAFSGDSVPVHLMTEQAFNVYVREIRPEGVIAVHITNTYIDLVPVLSEVAQRYGLQYVLLHTDGDKVTTNYSDWVLLSSNGPFIYSLVKPDDPDLKTFRTSKVSLWTDDYSNLLQVLRK